MKRDRTSAKVICFTVCYAACQAVAIWILKNLLVLERRMARPQGAGILADLKTCKALDPSCSKFPPYCAYQVCVWSLTTHLIPYPFPFFKRAIQALEKGFQEDTTQWARQCLWDTLLFSHGFFRFPVWSAGESFCISCQNCASATRPHCSLHTDLIPQPLQDLLYCYSSLPRFLPWRVLVSFLLLKHCICEWK